MISRYNKIKKVYNLGKRYLNDTFHNEGIKKIQFETGKTPSRTEIINYLLSYINNDESNYLEIGVRFPDENFNHINSKNKYGVDPGFENKDNPVEFKLTSDDFFEQLRNGLILNSKIKFDIIFIDGLHLANQVDKDIINSLDFISENGFIVIHDCNPPTEFHTLESHDYKLSPAKGYWNGTTWKAFFKWRQSKEIYSCCIDSDWGVGIITKKINLGESTQIINNFFEYNILNEYRNESLNLLNFENFKKLLNR